MQNAGNGGPGKIAREDVCERVLVLFPFNENVALVTFSILAVFLPNLLNCNKPYVLFNINIMRNNKLNSAQHLLKWQNRFLYFGVEYVLINAFIV